MAKVAGGVEGTPWQPPHPRNTGLGTSWTMSTFPAPFLQQLPHSGMNAPHRSCSGLNECPAPLRSECPTPLVLRFERPAQLARKGARPAPLLLRPECTPLLLRSECPAPLLLRSECPAPLLLRSECPHRLVARVPRVAGTRPPDFPRAHPLPNCRVSPVFLSRRRRPAPIGIAARPGGGRAGSSRGCCANSGFGPAGSL